MSAIEQMTPIGLSDMKAVRLMNRVDQKYMAQADKLEALLCRIAGDYYVQHIGGDPIAPYHTLYFDTPGLEMYTHHHNQQLGRQKLRVRTYRSTGTTFFEVKDKDNRGKTHKQRIAIDAADFDRCALLPQVQTFATTHSHYDICALHQCVENWFQRITLVDHGMSERVTIDSGITFHNRATGIDANISHLLVIEVKHEVGAPTSAIEHALHDMHILPRRMSKYCIGTALTTPGAKANRFKPKLLYIAKLKQHSN